MRYVLLLRGINVGGKNKVVMSELKELLRGEGFSDVDSYINSGNLFFSSYESVEKIVLKIEKVLEENYEFSIPFALLSKEDYLEEMAGLPEWWKDEFARKDILFFSRGTDISEVLRFVEESEFYNEKNPEGSLATTLVSEAVLHMLKNMGTGNVDMVIMNSGGTRISLVPGKISYDDAYTLLPFTSNTIYILKMNLV